MNHSILWLKNWTRERERGGAMCKEFMFFFVWWFFFIEGVGTTIVFVGREGEDHCWMSFFFLICSFWFTYLDMDSLCSKGWMGEQLMLFCWYWMACAGWCLNFCIIVTCLDLLVVCVWVLFFFVLSVCIGIYGGLLIWSRLQHV